MAISKPRTTVVLFVSKVNELTARSLSLGRGLSPDDFHAVTIASDPQQVLDLQRTWQEMEINIPLVVVDSPYREFVRPAVEYVKSLHPGPNHTVTVIIPEFVVEHWWENFLHNQNALRLKGALLGVPWVVVISIPFHIGAAEAGRGLSTARGHKAGPSRAGRSPPTRRCRNGCPRSTPCPSSPPTPSPRPRTRPKRYCSRSSWRALAALTLSLPVAIAVALLLAIVALSYQQTVRAYPNGGGSYVVSRENLGLLPGLIAAASLMFGYVATVAVSVASGVAAITSAFPSLYPWRIYLAVGLDPPGHAGEPSGGDGNRAGCLPYPRMRSSSCAGD